jgi:hypothetical protein
MLPLPSLAVAMPHSSQTAVQDAQRRLAEAQEAQQAAQAATREAAEAAAQAAKDAGQPPPPDVGQPPAPPPPPAGVKAGDIPTAVYVPGEGWVIPMTRDMLRALEQRSERLTEQLRSATDRRDEVAQQLEEATNPAVIAGLEQRLKLLDERLVSLEGEISANSAQRASMAARLGAQGTSSTSDAPSGRNVEPPNDWPGIIAMLTLTPIAIAYAIRVVRRGKPPASAPVSEQAEARFAQLEQAIDTVAVEIERVAEGQRFVTKLLREGQPVPDFSAQRAGEGVRVGREGQS